MPFGPNPQGQPQVYGPYISQPREVFYSGREFAQFASPPLVIDGTNSRNPLNATSPTNTNYSWLLWAGMLFGRETSTNFWRPSVIGLTTGALTTGSTSIASDVNTVAEVARLLTNAGGNVNFTITGPPTASTVASSTASVTVTVTAASGTTITLSTTIGTAFISGSFIQPADGSQTIRYILADDQGVAVVDDFFNSINCQTDRMATGGGMINTGMLVNYPTDPGMKLYVKAALRAYGTGFSFLDDVSP